MNDNHSNSWNAPTPLPPGTVGSNGSFALPPGNFGAPPDFGSHHQQVNIFKVVHGMFRGRYLLTLILAGVIFTIGAAAGWFTNKPLYKSAGYIRVTPVNYDPVQGTADLLPFAEQFARTQAKIVTSERVISKAKASKAWQSLRVPNTPKEERAFRTALVVNPRREEVELIDVSFTHENPQIAYTALTQICEAYHQLFAEFEDRDRDATRERILRDEKRILEGNIRQIEEQITDLANNLGTTDPSAFMQTGNSRLMEVDARILDLELRIIASGGATDVPPPVESDRQDAAATQETDPAAPEGKSPPRQRSEMTYEEIAGVDPHMQGLLLQYNEVLSRKSILNDQGLGEKHIQMRQVNNEAARIEREIEERRMAFVEGRKAAEAEPGKPPRIHSSAAIPQPRNGPFVESVAALEIQLQKLKSRRQQIIAENRILARQKSELENRSAQLAAHRTELTQITQAIDSLRREREMMSSVARVEPILPTKAESFPSVDKRLRSAALLGGLGGMIPIVAIALFAMANRRFRFSDEAVDEAHALLPLLGILPRLPADLHDAEQAVAAAHCVHQIRTLVQISMGRKSKVIAVTSSNPGDGKTSMALGLGYSFAGSGSRTLLIDLDLIGQGLSRGLKMREQDGVLQTMIDGDVRDRIRATPMENLFLLPAGLQDDHRSANRLSGKVTSRVLAQVRDEFDIILVDTGPVLGSIEAHLVCAEADGVILVVGAGRERSQVKSAVDQLRRVNARLLGMVFNLAQGRDFRMSAASQSFRSLRPGGAPPSRPGPTDFPDLEPLPRVVAIDTKR